MENEFVPYELAVKLKALGFDEPCFKCKVIGQEHLDYTPSDYDDFPEQKEVEVLIPTFSQAFRWFRDKKLSDGSVCRHGKADGSYSYRWDILFEYGVYEERHFKMDYETYEEAELACLEKLIEIVESKSERDGN